eukprot:Colp12_sorted_trinity150504_noHs@10627
MIGYRHFSRARPNAAHEAIAKSEQNGHVHHILTQNVDGLHQAAGSSRVLELHGSIHEVTCLACHKLSRRSELQERLESVNHRWAKEIKEGGVSLRPDGDANIQEDMLSEFVVPPCLDCGGVLKPAVVFFGGSVPQKTIDFSYSKVEQSDGLLVVGSSLQVYSGLRYVRAAANANKPVVLLTVGPTRGDDLATCKIEGPCEHVLPELLHGH